MMFLDDCLEYILSRLFLLYIFYVEFTNSLKKLVTKHLDDKLLNILHKW